MCCRRYAVYHYMKHIIGYECMSRLSITEIITEINLVPYRINNMMT